MRQARAGVWAVLLVVLIACFGPALPAYAATITVTTTVDEFSNPGPGSGCSLREAVQSANTNVAFGGCSAGSGADTINLPPGTYTLTRTGANGTVTIRQSTVSGNTASSRGGGVWHDGSSGILTANDSTFSGNSSPMGGGIFHGIIQSTLTNVTLSGNSSARGGGILQLAGALKISHSTFVGNSSTTEAGGAVRVQGGSIFSRATYPVPGNATQITLVVGRLTPGQATTVPVTVVDECGSWPTCVGGGAGAGF